MDKTECPYLEREKNYINFKIEQFKILGQINFQKANEHERQLFEIYKLLIRYLFISNGSASIALLYNISKFEDLGAEKTICCFILGAVSAIISLIFSFFFNDGASFICSENAKKGIQQKSDEVLREIYNINKEGVDAAEAEKEDTDNNNKKMKKSSSPEDDIPIPVTSFFCSWVFMILSFICLIFGAIRILAIYGIDIFKIFS